MCNEDKAPSFEAMLAVLIVVCPVAGWAQNAAIQWCPDHVSYAIGNGQGSSDAITVTFTPKREIQNVALLIAPELKAEDCVDMEHDTDVSCSEGGSVKGTINSNGTAGCAVFQTGTDSNLIDTAWSNATVTRATQPRLSQDSHLRGLSLSYTLAR
jgi:hypothetical protein